MSELELELVLILEDCELLLGRLSLFFILCDELVCSASSLKLTGTKTEQAAEVGKLVAEAAKAKGVEEVVFDRGGYLYHGRVAALATAAREAGLKF